MGAAWDAICSLKGICLGAVDPFSNVLLVGGLWGAVYVQAGRGCGSLLQSPLPISPPSMHARVCDVSLCLRAAARLLLRVIHPYPYIAV